MGLGFKFRDNACGLMIDNSDLGLRVSGLKLLY